MSEDLTEEELEALSQAMGDGHLPEGLDDVPSLEDKGKQPGMAASHLTEAQGATAGAALGQIAHAQFMQLEELAAAADLPPQELERMSDVKVDVEVVLGATKRPLEEILRMTQGCVITLERLAGEPVDVTANGQLIARAEVVVIDDSFGIKILDIVGTHQKLNVLQG